MERGSSPSARKKKSPPCVEQLLSFELTDIFTHLCRDLSVDSYSRDYLLRRLKNEGVTVVTEVLPKFAKHVLASIESGHFCPNRKEVRKSFSEIAWKGGLPRFLRGFLVRIFDSSGKLLDSPDPLGLWQIRQLCEYLYKLALPYDEQRLVKFRRDFVVTDNEVTTASNASDSFLSFSELVRKNVETNYRFPSYDHVLASCRPRYGPGTFSTERRVGHQATYKVTGNNKTRVPRWAAGISGYYRSYPASRERIEVCPDTSDHSELLFVPKDSRGPRVIMREPLQRLALHMSFSDWLSGYLEKQTDNRINFQDQQINRDLAKIGSVTGCWATLDLKEASDRVSNYLVTRLFRNIPCLRYFTSKRSTHVKMPDGSLHKLNKLAGMGSGLTFVTMAFIIHSAISTALSPIYGSFRKAGSMVYVYGDDIIVPTQDVDRAVKALELLGLRVNLGKSFKNPRSRFRESCGGDYFLGNGVAPVRLRLSAGVTYNSGTYYVAYKAAKGLVQYVSDGRSLLQIERHCRELARSGLSSLAEFFYQRLESVMGPLPYVYGETDALGRWSPSRFYRFGSIDTSLPCESSDGTYALENAWIPKPVSKVPDGLNPYYYIGKLLSREGLTPLEALMEPPDVFRGMDVPVRGAVKLRFRRVHPFRIGLGYS